MLEYDYMSYKDSVKRGIMEQKMLRNKDWEKRKMDIIKTRNEELRKPFDEAKTTKKSKKTVRFDIDQIENKKSTKDVVPTSEVLNSQSKQKSIPPQQEQQLADASKIKVLQSSISSSPIGDTQKEASKPPPMNEIQFENAPEIQLNTKIHKSLRNIPQINNADANIAETLIKEYKKLKSSNFDDIKWESLAKSDGAPKVEHALKQQKWKTNLNPFLSATQKKSQLTEIQKNLDHFQSLSTNKNPTLDNKKSWKDKITTTRSFKSSVGVAPKSFYQKLNTLKARTV